MARIDGDALDRAGSWLADRRPQELLAALEHATGAVLPQLDVGEK
ncbi:hypothetical protein [Peterkaempfera griseoplana]|nr:hypothetical protein [Peterkaempfera griseoplana]